jgi:hypothetical protein
LLNKVEQNYTTIEKEALAMVYALHKFKQFLLGNKFVFYVDHMALIYLVNKPHVSRMITRWLLLFLEYEFIVVYKLGRTHVVVDVLSKLANSSKPLGVQDQTMDASLFSIKPMWMQEVKSLNAKNFKLSSKIEISQKGKTFYSERVEGRNNVQNVTR